MTNMANNNPDMNRLQQTEYKLNKYRKGYVQTTLWVPKKHKDVLREKMKELIVDFINEEEKTDT